MAAETTAPAAAPETSAALAPTRIRLEFLDGIRGAASVYVMLTHLVLFINPALFAPVSWLAPATNWMHYGATSVAIFIVLSGYCLMLPVARTADLSIPGGFRPYILRRARRILPPYYAALIISLALLRLLSRPIHDYGTFWQTMIPESLRDTVSHLLLIHNASNNWIFKIDAPMWSVATEWQIYFVFPLILLPLFRRSAAAMLAAALIIGVAPMFFFHTGESAAPWFTVLFGFGMAGAAINFNKGEGWKRLQERVNWPMVCVAATVLAVAWGCAAHRRPNLKWKGELVQDLFTGLATMSLLVACAKCVSCGRRPRIVALLSSRPMMFLGAISYSLYLMHAPILGALDIGIRRLSLTPTSAAMLYIFGGIISSIALTYPFHRLFERPFMSAGGFQTKPREGSAQA